MSGLIKNELIKLLHNRKVYALALAILLINMIPVFLTVLMRLKTMDGQSYPSTMFGILSAWVLPLFLLVLVAEMFTDEYAGGTLSLSLVHPVSRVQLLTAKIAALFVLILSALLFALLTGYGIGTLFFGWGTEYLVSGVAYSVLQGVQITVLMYLGAAVPLLAFTISVIFLALILSSGASVVGISAGILFLFSILELLAEEIKPYLITTYFRSFSAGILLDAGSGPHFVFSFLAIYGVFFYLAGLAVFLKKDILT